ncbi:uncharacterized protein LOC113596839 isoform X2 [Acinonyx jubatus]|uniref:Uncharacterized protein LOC113596839 isoform X2 n=1 Tax=Acinonyx jubatus TaxID=32536 RepID=A0ABM3NPS8_ACIJB|nr:uncharacterized protein LOC113596839 isoform X2 [Acinonyx jubatus]
MNVLRLALVLTLLGGPQALHMRPQDPNFTENLVDGNWFSIARASNEPELRRTDSDTMFFIHKTHVTFKAMQFHVHRRVKGRCIPIVLTASKTRRKFQYVLKRKYEPAASSSPGVGSPGDSRAENGQELAGQDAASQEGPTGCGTRWALSAAGGWGELAGVSGKGGKPAPGPAPSWGLTGHEHQVVNGCKGTGGLPGSSSRLVENSAPLPPAHPPDSQMLATTQSSWRRRIPTALSPSASTTGGTGRRR